MRFRQKLTFNLVVLALVPLLASGLLAVSLIRDRQTARIDHRLSMTVSAAAIAYGAALQSVQNEARGLALRPDVRYALSGRGDLQRVRAAAPGLYVQLQSGGAIVAGTAPPGPAWRAVVDVGPARNHDCVMVWQPLDRRFAGFLRRRIRAGRQTGLVVVGAGSVGVGGDGAQDASVGGEGVRAAAVTVSVTQGGPVQLVAIYPTSALSESVHRAQRQVWIVLLGVALLTVLAVRYVGAPSAADLENARLQRLVERQAVTDALTGLANRRQLLAALTTELERAQRFGQETSLILFDLDDFKLVNDTMGHLAGDAVLHAVAEKLRETVREIDVAARYGGEEFAVLLPQTGREGAVNLAERLRVGINRIEVEFDGQTIANGSASFGIATSAGAAGGGLDLIAQADGALYAAKRNGKNTVA